MNRPRDWISPDNALSNLGPCCNCERTNGVRNIVMLDRRSPTPGHGWGCVVCDLPFDGAVVVLCDDCIAVSPPKFVCTGYPAADGRTSYADLPPDEFEHDDDKHGFQSDTDMGG